MEMMNKSERLELLSALGSELSNWQEEFGSEALQAYHANNWFTKDNVRLALKAICDRFLERSQLFFWADSYPVTQVKPKKIGLIMAGNLPLVGFQDMLAVFVAGHQALIKLSSKDEVLMKFILDKMNQLDPRTKEHFFLVDRIQSPDAVIATGSNNSGRYFEYYFGKYPHIIRKNRNSLGIISGNETRVELEALCHDFLDFFGLGCRNVSKIYIPEKYDFKLLWDSLDSFAELRNHHKYMNNYDYNYAVYLLNNETFFTNGFLILKEDTSLLSRIACVHYEYYTDLNVVISEIEAAKDQVQCVASGTGKLTGMKNEVKFGLTQQPGLFDYADGVDTMEFLIHLE